MSEELYTGENWKSSKGFWVIADDTNAKEPDKYYDTAKYEYRMWVEELPNGKLGVWLNKQPMVTDKETLEKYLPYYNNHYRNCLVLVHMILRKAYGAPYQDVWVMFDLSKYEYQMHHSITVNGLLALMYADRVRMPMTPEGQFCSELREFFENDNWWLYTKGKLYPVTKEVHRRITENQTYDYSADIDENITFRTNRYLTYPKNNYYQFLKGRWLVNRKMCVGTPRYSQWGKWELL